LLEKQSFGKGKIITNPNCSTTGLVIALKPLWDHFGIEAVHVVTMQALSGAGYPGVSSLDAMDNVIPFISGEEEKMEKEPLKLLGNFENGQIKQAGFTLSASCNRVPVVDGHLKAVSVKFKNKFSINDVIQAFESFEPEIRSYNLPSAPRKAIYYFRENNQPQPRLLRSLEGGMAVSVGRVRECPILDIKFVVLSHNTVRGAAGGAILNAELLKIKGHLNSRKI
ncbi:MAG TPA: aspartate-semialdehyde dehydrogenase, partial [Calditrichaeota bacterium]|nr:aspartate-semialdehyde dehydrogenase [Calditrichota bacterium]